MIREIERMVALGEPRIVERLKWLYIEGTISVEELEEGLDQAFGLKPRTSFNLTQVIGVPPTPSHDELMAQFQRRRHE